MKIRKIFAVAVIGLFLSSCKQVIFDFETADFKLGIDQKGNVATLYDKVRQTDYLAEGQPSPLVQIRVNNEFEIPSDAAWDESTGVLSFTYPKNGVTLKVESEKKEGYVTFEVKEVTAKQPVDLIVWGPYATEITQTIGECVGVVRDSLFALGIQSLNAKTMGGYPSTEDDVDPQFDIFATTSLVDVADSLNVLYRGQTAKHTDTGSVLQAYCRNREKERVIPMWNHTHYTASAYNDGGIVGSRIALFGCRSSQVLDQIEKIELGENLPHPELNGVWMKRAPEAAQAYIIYPFNENNIDEAIEFTKKTGLKYLYHGGPFETWGNFKLLPKEFPSGMEGLKKCVDKANAAGLKLGLHTLSNFITTNDAFVSPVPNEHLAKVGSSVLTADITSVQTEIEINDPMFFNQMENNNLHGVMIDNELVRYERVSEEAPWKLLNCQRGAWGTQAASHAEGDTISKLIDHGYKVFLTDIELTKQVARNIAEIFNQTGIEQISFDGLEGCFSTGLGQYGLSLMMEEWYKHLLPQYRNAINDASMTTHYNWHTFTRMNWGEPWYAGFRDSQLNYRLMNQDFYRRNLIPCMLGWFRYDANTSIEDIEWLLARSAAFDAGYTLVTNGTNVRENGMSESIIRAIREWENARLCGAFPAALKSEMEHVANEYSLTETSPTTWTLTPMNVERFKHQNKVLQPGEPVVSKWKFENKNKRQPLQFILKANDDISSISMELANYATISIDQKLQKGHYLKYTGGEYFIIYDENWKEVKRIKINENQMYFPQGSHSIVFSCVFAHGSDLEKYASMEIKTAGETIKLTATRQKNN